MQNHYRNEGNVYLDARSLPALLGVLNRQTNAVKETL